MFMRSLRTLALIAVLVLLVRELRSLRRENDDSREQLRRLEQQAGAVAKPANSTPQASAPASAAVSERQAPPPGALKQYSDRNVLGDPDYGSAVARRHRRQAFANYRRAIDSLNLSSSEAAQLKELIAQRDLAREDSGDVLDRSGSVSAELREKAYKAAMAEADRKIQELLGPERHAMLQENYRASSTEGMTWGEATDFWDAGLPLSSDQRTQLARARAALGYGRPYPVDDVPDPDSGLRPSDVRLFEIASGFLSPEQLAFLRARRLEDIQYSRAVKAVGGQRR